MKTIDDRTRLRIHESGHAVLGCIVGLEPTAIISVGRELSTTRIADLQADIDLNRERFISLDLTEV